MLRNNVQSIVGSPVMAVKRHRSSTRADQFSDVGWDKLAQSHQKPGKTPGGTALRLSHPTAQIKKLIGPGSSTTIGLRFLRPMRLLYICIHVLSVEQTLLLRTPTSLFRCDEDRDSPLIAHLNLLFTRPSLPAFAILSANCCQLPLPWQARLGISTPTCRPGGNSRAWSGVIYSTRFEMQPCFTS